MPGGEVLNPLPVFSQVKRADIGLSHPRDSASKNVSAIREVAGSDDFNNKDAESPGENL